VTEETQTPDPRFGLQAPLTQIILTTPGGLRFESRQQREATYDVGLTGLTETLDINGRVQTRVFDVATRRYHFTSAAGRNASLTVDPQGRPLQQMLPGLDPWDYIYDGRGRLTSLVQGSRTTVRPSPTTPPGA